MVKTIQMEKSKLINRLLWMPLGFIKGILELSNDKARDFQNTKRFPNSIFRKNVCISEGSSIGKNVLLHENVTVNHSSIGDYSYINNNSLIQNTTIGSYCSISHGVKMGLGAHPIHKFSTSPIFYKKNNGMKVKVIEKDSDFVEYKPITIGNDVWIGANALIMDGVTIADGAIIAAGSVVTKNIDAYSIVGGVPAKHIKYRFNENKIKQLLETKWWLKEPQDVLKIKESLEKIVNLSS